MASFGCLMVVLPLLLQLTSTSRDGESFEECASKRDVLLRALFTTGSNLNELDRVFYPAGQQPSRFIQADYYFNNTGDDNCIVSYFWASGGFLLIQPPSIFQFTSLFFNYPANNLDKIKLTLPQECAQLINVTEDGNCSCREEDSVLERLTQQVGITVDPHKSGTTGCCALQNRYEYH